MDQERKPIPMGLSAGEFKDDLLNGKGKITYLDGSLAEGEFKDGNLHGPGN